MDMQLSFLNFSIVGIRPYIDFISFRCAVQRSHTLILSSVVTLLILIVMCHDANLSEYH